MTKAMLPIVLLTLGGLYAGCGTATRAGSHTVKYHYGQGSEQAGQGAPISATELQDYLFRFSSRFSESIRDAFRPIENSPQPAIARQGALHRLAYDSSALSIALEPRVEANLLDMVTFVELSRDVMRDYWIPKVYGAAGEPVLRAFDQATTEIWKIADKVLTPEQHQILADVIREWRAEHPDQIAVEGVRIGEFSMTARNPEIQQEVSGLLASVKQVVTSTDEARLLGERYLFYAQRAPFLFRRQAEIGMQNILGNAFQPSPEKQEMNESLRDLLAQANETLQTSGVLVQNLAHQPRVVEASANLMASLASLADTLKQIDHTPPNNSHLEGLASKLDAEIRILRSSLLVVGALLILLGFIASLTSRLLAEYISKRWIRPKEDAPHERKAA